MSKSEYLDGAALDAALLLLTPTNRLVCQLAVATALRIGDCLSIKTAQLLAGQRITVKEQKTGKSRRVYIPKGLHGQLLAQAGTTWVFEHRTDPTKHRSRQTVWADLKRAARALRLDANLTPHSMRKIWAVRQFQATHDLAAVQAALNHSDPAVTMLYALADQMAAIRSAQGHKRPSRPR